ncbi:MAG: prolyl oligopeptidase family serine peptidase, partial [Micromonosporaceae bacterium]
SVVREFDLESARFVSGGFTLPEAKSFVEWIDADRIYVGTDVGDGSMTTSGYPRLVKLWRRGTPLSDATTVYEAKPDDILTAGYHDPITGRGLIERRIDFYRSETYLRAADGLERIEAPDDAEVDPHREWLLIRTRSEWAVGGATYPPGALLAARFDDYLAGVREFTVLFEPDDSTALSSYAWTRHHVIVTALQDVKSRLTVLTPGPDGWRREPLPGVPEVGSANIVGTDPDGSDEYWLNVSGFTQPATLLRGELPAGPAEAEPAEAGPAEARPAEAEPTEAGPAEAVKQQPAFFDASGMSVRQHFATSEDGTRIPYFVVAPADPSGPALLTGYGGFEVAMTPAYSGVVGRGWLARGGTYVVANLRGGGEYGPQWHQSVQRENRLKVYQDLAAVARDLADRGLTTPERLGVVGGSNGGLLTGVMLTRYPSLFGAVVSQVPLLDMRRYHVLLAGASWMTEYGDPDSPSDWAYLREYSPYQNVHAGRTYPPTLITTSTRDDRVHPGHARKMVARMREHGHDVRYYENIEGGHGAAANNEQQAFKWALVFRFLHRTLR